VHHKRVIVGEAESELDEYQSVFGKGVEWSLIRGMYGNWVGPGFAMYLQTARELIEAKALDGECIFL
jgi:hypothetical protein